MNKRQPLCDTPTNTELIKYRAHRFIFIRPTHLIFRHRDMAYWRLYSSLKNKTLFCLPRIFSCYSILDSVMAHFLTKILQRRTSRRTPVSTYIGVYKLDSQEFMGHISNRSTTGYMITSTKPFEPQQTYRLAMHYQIQEQKMLHPIELQCLWAQRENNNGFFNAGFKITEANHLFHAP